MLRIVKQSVLRVSRLLGYDIVPLRDMKERDLALHLRELLRRLQIDCVLDVGANAGQYRDFLRAVQDCHCPSLRAVLEGIGKPGALIGTEIDGFLNAPGLKQLLHLRGRHPQPQ